MWVLSEQLKNAITHNLRIEDVSVEWAVKKKMITRNLIIEDVSIEWAVKTSITHRLRVKDVSIEWAINKHNYAHSKSQRCEYWVSSQKTQLHTG